MSGIDAGLDLQPASRLLVVVSGNFASFDVCFDFHWLLLLMDLGLICGERRRVIGFDGGDCRLHSNRRKMKAKLPAIAQNFACLFLRLMFILAFLPYRASISSL
jgi:hypothetical protein